jgi:hypothetical protein
MFNCAAAAVEMRAGYAHPLSESVDKETIREKSYRRAGQSWKEADLWTL